MRNDDVIADLLAQDRVILAREHPRLRSALVRAVRDRRLVRLLPGVFADPGNADQVLTRATAATRWDPSAVIQGRAAAALSYWPEILVSTVDVAAPNRHSPQPGFTFERRRIPADLVQRYGPVALTTAPLTAMELATVDDTDAIDIALRRKVADLASLRDALLRTSKRRGNAERWRVLLDSRAEPWSRAERLTHRLYRDAGIDGWVGNLKVWVPHRCSTFYLDIGFERQRLCCEVDGRETHDTPDAFETDRLRQNLLVLAGWSVLRFTWTMLTLDPDYVVWATRQALATADGKRPLATRILRDTPWMSG
jgi:very-short-patch-repair endonuclease